MLSTREQVRYWVLKDGSALKMYKLRGNTSTVIAAEVLSWVKRVESEPVQLNLGLEHNEGRVSRPLLLYE